MATRLDGKALAQRIREQLVGEVVELTRALGRPPGLGVILVGEDEGSQIYVRNKERAAQQAGIRSVTERLPASIDLTALLAAV
ncbi:MAG: tetrahydrofolate dehydrogenase/cyclohydrolase catalytic domain-containing protein, partial [Myxococcota bacterium]